jgi:hypothetical protein
VYFLLPVVVIGFDSLLRQVLLPPDEALLSQITDALLSLSPAHQPITLSTQSLDLTLSFESALLLDFFASYLRSLTAFPSKGANPESIALRFRCASELISSFLLPLSDMLVRHQEVAQHRSFHEMLRLLMACIFAAPSCDPTSYLPLVPESQLRQLSASFDGALTSLTSLGPRLRDETQICDWIASLAHALK